MSPFSSTTLPTQTDLLKKPAKQGPHLRGPVSHQLHDPLASTRRRKGKSATMIPQAPRPARAAASGPAFHSPTAPAGRFRRNTKDDPEGERYVRITYSCGDWIKPGPKLAWSRLRRFSKRARRELRPQFQSCPVGGTMAWTLELQHYLQDSCFDALLAWFARLPNVNPEKDFVHRGYHPWIELGEDGGRLEEKGFQGLMLLDHSLEYLHLREPLDNRRVRTRIWNLLREMHERDALLECEEVYEAWHLLQCKTRWLREAAVRQEDPRAAARLSTGSLQSNTSLSAETEELLAEQYGDWEPKNEALMRNIIRKTVFALEKRGVRAFEDYLSKLTAIAREHYETADSLVRVMLLVHGDRNSHGGRHISVERSWKEAAAPGESAHQGS